MSEFGAVLRPTAYRLVPRRWDHRRGLMSEGGVSLLLHLLVLVALILAVPHRRFTPPAESDEVAVVFDGGAKQSTPQTEQSRRAPPVTSPHESPREAKQSAGAPPPAGAASPAPAAPQAAPQPMPSPPSQAAPAPTGAPEKLALPPDTRGLSLPQPMVSARHGVAPPAPNRALPRPPAPARAMHEASPGRSPFASEFTPMAMSLGGAPPKPSEGRLERGISLSMPVNAQNQNIMTRYAEARHTLGEDWWAAFSRFVEDHKYYPLAAAQNGEDGQVVLRMTVERDGTVKSVHVELSSGAPELDAAWLSEFRGVKVPAFPPGTVENEVTFSASMTYILEHM